MSKQRLDMKRIIIGVLVFFVAIFIGFASYFIKKNPISSEQGKAKRIAENYLKDRYGVNVKADNIDKGIMRGADYSVYFKVKDTRTAGVGVDVDSESVLYDTYLHALIIGEMEERCVDDIKEYWNNDTRISFDATIMYPDDKYVRQDKSIDLDRAINNEKFDLYIFAEELTKREEAASLEKTIKYIRQYDIILNRILLYNYDEDRNYKSYIIDDYINMESAEELYKFLVEYKEDQEQ